MPDVTLDLYPGDAGQYAAEVQVRPGRPWADLAAGSASVYLGEAPAPEPGVQRLTCREAVTYPHGLSPLRDHQGALSVLLYRPLERDTLLAFDRRIDARYTEFCVTIGEHPAGTVDVAGLAVPCIGELAAIDAPTRIEYETRTADLMLPPDLEAIVAECRALHDRSFARYVIWLTPRP